MGRLKQINTYQQMNTENKNNITAALQKYMDDRGLSGNRLAKTIGNVSAATISQILNHKWQENDQLVSVEMWNHLGSFLGVNNNWNIVKTKNYKRVWNLTRDCQQQSISRAISAAPGLSKSVTLQAYASSNPNVYYIECKEHWNRKVFLNKIRQAMGLAVGTENVSEIAEQITDHIRKATKPLIIIDEADKLKDTVITFFISLYNDTNNRCGYLLAGSVFFEKKMLKGVSKNQLGYSEAFSRIGRQFHHLYDLTATEVRDICEANGLEDDEAIKVIINECITSKHNDLRRVNRMVIDSKSELAKNKAA